MVGDTTDSKAPVDSASKPSAPTAAFPVETGGAVIVVMNVPHFMGRPWEGTDTVSAVPGGEVQSEWTAMSRASYPGANVR